ncbi:MAG: glutathione S-transferase family protein [Alcanivorax sp.]|jgi:glutathione S-transferase|uniref:glutathione S-transferase family protein n=1 Tax=Alcanivorax TaxID=59753 RepID=UPI000C3BAADE|nr:MULTISPECIES: glutathione S-transferase family protein [Alcanivorax]MAC15724.1 glutathione S-transferase [Alcanivorax sp.]MBL4569871.1 glutathione S-transferase family protein [Alcanivorax sp.]MBP21691.1 glutathione S-transferase [Alcanivorax sp.]MDF1636610.1 glutathione S-transferase family protein [Alcanivorax jadensis]|tara:strand:- start:785 stop:1525 length:741 start_codon:yes stop_codon:yes gene_type:complete
MAERILYQFPISHYCEKSRWQLDHKGLAYRTVNLLPVTHRVRTQWLARTNTVPLLRDGKRRVSDSTKIAYYLEKYYPDQPLLPKAGDARARVIELEQQFDRYGVHVRRWVYGQILDRSEVMTALVGDCGLPGPLERLAKPLVREAIRRGYAINPQRVMRSEQRVEEALVLLESELKKGQGQYLVGDRFSLADITAASMLAPLISPQGSPWDLFDETTLSPTLRKQMENWRARPAGKWLLAMYAQDR